MFYSAEEIPLANRKLIHGLGLIVLLQVLLPTALAPTAAAASCVEGILPPQFGDWVIYNDTTIPVNCHVVHSDDILVLGGKRFAVSGGSLTLTGWINVSQGATVEVTGGGVISVVCGGAGVQMQMFTGSILVVDHATLNLDGFGAPGVVNQANIEFRDSTITSCGYFSASANSMTVRSSFINVTAPPVGSGQTGGDAYMRIGGRVSSDIADSTFLAQAASGGGGTQGARGGDAGSVVALFEPRSVARITVTVIGGLGGKGGTGANHGSGGEGGVGGSASLTVTSESISSSEFSVRGGAGGSGGRGDAASLVSAGSGGAGRPGGAATLDVTAPNTFTLRSSSLEAVGGSGGTGGSGGPYQGNALGQKGGNGGAGAPGGAGSVTASALNQVIVSASSSLSARGGSGGLGGNYGLGSSTSGSTNGKPGIGGEGGRATARTNSSATALAVDNSTIDAQGGSGGNGGQGGQEGGGGGGGGDGWAGAFGRTSVTITQSCYNATGGGGGAGASGSQLSGIGGSAGNATVKINGTGTIFMDRSCAGARVGERGAASEPGRVGLSGIDDLHINGTTLTISNSNFGNPLDDFAGCVAGTLYNAVFTRHFPGSEVIPLGCGVINRLWDLDVYVHNGRDPIPTVNVAVSRCPGFGTPFFATSPTEVNGHSRFVLLGATYTSDVTKASFVGCYSVETSFGGQLKKPLQISMDKVISVVVVYPANVFQPVITVLQPRPLSYVINPDHPNIDLLIKVDDNDDVLSGVPTLFKVWACISREPRCIDRVEITDSRVRNNNTGEVTYASSFNVSSVADFPSGAYYACAKAWDGVLESPWTCTNLTLNQDIDQAPPIDLSAGARARDKATKLVGFDGKVNNEDQLAGYTTPITILVYRWDFDGDGTWDFNSPRNGSTVHIYPQVNSTTLFVANFSVIDSLGREAYMLREITIDPIVYPPSNPLRVWGGVIAVSVLGLVGLTVAAYTLQRRRTQRIEEEGKRREAEILANIHECPRCGDLLPEKFAICTHCATEDSIANARKTVAELKQVGVIVLEEEDLIDKAYVSFEGRDFATANAFLDKVKSRVEVNKKRHKQTTQMIRRQRLHIKMLEEQGRDLSSLEPEVYHAELALGRSDFDGAEQMVETVRKKVQAVIYEDKKREILDRITKLERNIKAYSAPDEAGTQKAVEASRLLERAKLALGKKLYLDSMLYYTDAFTIFEGSPPEPLIKEPTNEELDLFETRLKMQEEGVYMGPSTQAAGEGKLWRPGDKEFKIEGEKIFRPGDQAGTMTEAKAHGASQEVSGTAASYSSAPAVPGAVQQGPTTPAPPPPAPPKADASAPAPAVFTPAPPKAQAGAPARPVAAPAPPAPLPGALAAKCTVCGTALQPTWKKCPKCATPVPGASPAAAPGAPPAPAAPAPALAGQVADKCPKCAKPVKPQWKKCPYCATALHG